MRESQMLTTQKLRKTAATKPEIPHAQRRLEVHTTVPEKRRSGSRNEQPSSAASYAREDLQQQADRETQENLRESILEYAPDVERITKNGFSREQAVELSRKIGESQAKIDQAKKLLTVLQDPDRNPLPGVFSRVGAALRNIPKRISSLLKPHAPEATQQKRSVDLSNPQDVQRYLQEEVANWTDLVNYSNRPPVDISRKSSTPQAETRPSSIPTQPEVRPQHIPEHAPEDPAAILADLNEQFESALKQEARQSRKTSEQPMDLTRAQHFLERHIQLQQNRISDIQKNILRQQQLFSHLMESSADPQKDRRTLDDLQADRSAAEEELHEATERIKLAEALSARILRTEYQTAPPSTRTSETPTLDRITTPDAFDRPSLTPTLTGVPPMNQTKPANEKPTVPRTREISSLIPTIRGAATESNLVNPASEMAQIYKEADVSKESAANAQLALEIQFKSVMEESFARNKTPLPEPGSLQEQRRFRAWLNEEGDRQATLIPQLEKNDRQAFQDQQFTIQSVLRLANQPGTDPHALHEAVILSSSATKRREQIETALKRARQFLQRKHIFEQNRIPPARRTIREGTGNN